MCFECMYKILLQLTVESVKITFIYLGFGKIKNLPFFLFFCFFFSFLSFRLLHSPHPLDQPFLLPDCRPLPSAIVGSHFLPPPLAAIFSPTSGHPTLSLPLPFLSLSRSFPFFSLPLLFPLSSLFPPSFLFLFSSTILLLPSLASSLPPPCPAGCTTSHTTRFSPLKSSSVVD